MKNKLLLSIGLSMIVFAGVDLYRASYEDAFESFMMGCMFLMCRYWIILCDQYDKGWRGAHEVAISNLECAIKDRTELHSVLLAVKTYLESGHTAEDRRQLALSVAGGDLCDTTKEVGHASHQR